MREVCWTGHAGGHELTTCGNDESTEEERAVNPQLKCLENQLQLWQEDQVWIVCDLIFCGMTGLHGRKVGWILS